MRIKEIKPVGMRVYEVTLVPNWLERVFNIKEKTVKFKDTGSEYMVGGQTVYRNEDGSKRGNGDRISREIDNFRNKF
jgi:hypothetical protein